ncbi:monosaccharide ABC transporter membrane protein (CUT2 family) [Motilibacter rhizosphaerae]|uniref:Monosaccharide ABC transporter membrane protein (CUT2 family) n=1 Tax=Motilibacter rhizosphaerae TaxID=598652 RepID=A0A4Q7NT39_9ACTN|nr:ABC transporter permease [Motilibacter rhizosphaerae]RZS89958.1 monosaccharide ABC transporter membrane protein (CUT2 family) [Motilibacter rhizosphaerae]
MSTVDTPVTAGGPDARLPEGDPGEGLSRGERLAALAQQRGSLVVLLLTVLVASLVFDTFGSVDNLRDICLQSSFLAVVALGMSFVILTGGIDLSVGSVYALGGVVAAWASSHGTVAALVAPVVVCGAVGLLNGLLIVRAGMAPFIVTLTTLLFARGLLLSVTTEGSVTRVVPSGSAFATMGQGSALGIGYPVWIAVGLYALGVLVLQRTGFGQTVLAIGSNEDAARLMGLPVGSVLLRVYVMSGVLAGFGGALAAAQASSGVTTTGVGLELSAISAVVIGGTLLTGGAGTTGGTLAGVLLLGVIANIINQIGFSNSNWQSVVNGGFLVLVVVIQTFLARRQRL